MRWADTDSEDSDDEFQTAGSGIVNTAMIDLSVSSFHSNNNTFCVYINIVLSVRWTCFFGRETIIIGTIRPN